MLASDVVFSDETSVRVSGKTWWQWVFVGTRSVLHVIRPSGKSVVQTLFGAVRPAVWVSDMLGSQRGHASQWQVRLGHYAELRVMPTFPCQAAQTAVIAAAGAA